MLKKSKDLPELGGHIIAYDICGDKWIVEAMCFADGGAPEGCDSLSNLLRNFDYSGAIREEIESGRLGENDIIVGVSSMDDDEELQACVWGSGVFYIEEM